MPGRSGVRLKDDSLIGDLAKASEAEHLESARVRQDRARPIHEPVQPAQLANGFMSRPQKQMIGIAKNDLRVQIVQQIPRKQPFHLGQRAH